MKNLEVIRYQNRLDDLFHKVAELPVEAEIHAHWARYLCVLASGYLETATRAIFSDYAKRMASPYVANYVESQLKNLQNPKMNRIIELAKSFNSHWGTKLEKDTEGQLKDSVDSIVNNRNQIAHGQNVGITYTRVQDYYQNATKVMEIIEQMCNP